MDTSFSVRLKRTDPLYFRKKWLKMLNVLNFMANGTALSVPPQRFLTPFCVSAQALHFHAKKTSRQISTRFDDTKRRHTKWRRRAIRKHTKGQRNVKHQNEFDSSIYDTTHMSLHSSDFRIMHSLEGGDR
ncbi:hypothetical protein ACOME3_007213 [Neoechinorhynchus agilis]